MSEPPLRSLGRYRLLRRIGRGGMAEVFEARAEGAAGVTKAVCVKRILPRFAGDRRFVRMFVSEARIAMSLDHGNIAQVFDFGQEGSELYLAMELVDGHSLSRVARSLRMRGLRFPVAVALQVIREICQALQYAHERTDADGRRLGIVHRDVSPQNVLLAYDGQVKLVDFGIARASSATGTGGGLAGKVPYMAPEQARDEAVDPRADVFGVGAVLYELLSGRTPFPADLDPAAFHHVQPPIPSLSEVAPRVDPVLAVLVDRAIAAEPGSRFPSARSFQEALATYAERRGLRAGEDDVGRLVRHLFADDLAETGRPVDVPPDFGRGLEATTDGSPPPGEGRRALAWVAAGAVAVLAVAFVLSWRGGEDDVRDVRVTSRPPGARVLLDGRDTGVVTDGILEGLAVDRVYRLGFEHVDHPPTAKNLLPHETEVVVALPPRPAMPPTPTPPARPRIEPVPEPVTVDEGADGARVVRLDPRRATVPLDRLNARWFDLPGDGPHRVEIEGQLMITFGRDLETVVWLAVDVSGELAGGGLVSVGAPARLPDDARRVGLLVVRARGGCPMNSGSVHVRTLSGHQEVAAGALDVQRHCVSFRDHVDAAVPLQGDRGHRIRYEGPEDGPVVLLVGTSASPLALTRPHDEAIGALLPGGATRVNYSEAIHLVAVGMRPETAGATLRIEAGPAGVPLTAD